MRRTRRSSARSATSRTRPAAPSSGSGTSRTATGPRPATASCRRSAPARQPSREGRWVQRDGSEIDVAWSCTVLPKIESGPVWLIAGTDITDRKRHEAEVRRSRSRIVAAADDARRRIERNLHDGAQQRLIALLLAAARRTTRRGRHPTLPSTARSLELAAAVKELRELAQGIHPSALSERGLAAALRIVASRAPVPVELDVTTTPLEHEHQRRGVLHRQRGAQQRREVRRGDARRGSCPRDGARADRRRRGRRQGRGGPDGRYRARAASPTASRRSRGGSTIDSPAGGGTRASRRTAVLYS